MVPHSSFGFRPIGREWVHRPDSLTKRRNHVCLPHPMLLLPLHLFYYSGFSSKTTSTLVFVRQPSKPLAMNIYYVLTHE